MTQLELKLSPGHFKNNYKNSSDLGEGAFGVVVKAIHRTNNTEYAVKKVHIGEWEDLELYLRESESHSKLENPNIVAYTDSWLEEETGSPGYYLYIVMELGDGTLDQWLREHPNKEDRPVRKMKKWMQQLMSGLDYIHSMDMLHRDLKPSNIIMFPDGGETVLKISDFGLVKAARNKDGRTISQHTGGVGTELYMAPELIKGEGTYGKAVDIYSMGLIFIEMAYPMNRTQRRTAFQGLQKGEAPRCLIIMVGDTKPAIKLKATLLGITAVDPAERLKDWSNPNNYFRK